MKMLLVCLVMFTTVLAHAESICAPYNTQEDCVTGLNRELEVKLMHMTNAKDANVEDINKIVNGYIAVNAEFTNLLKVAAGKGIASAQYRLGIAYYNGDGQRAPINHVEAVRLLEKVVSNPGGGAYAANAHEILAYLYSNGIGIKRNEKVSFSHFKACAEKENVNCMANTAMNYLSGYGTKEDIEQAVAWSDQAQKGMTAATSVEAKKLIGTIADIVADYRLSTKNNEAIVQAVKNISQPIVEQRAPAGSL